MIAGIIATVVIGVIAFMQMQRADAWKTAATTWREACVDAIKALEGHHEQAVIMKRRLECISAALPLHFAAAARGDARHCHAILAAAIAVGNQVTRDRS